MSWLKIIEAPVKAKVTKVSPDGKKISIDQGPGKELNIDLDKAPEVDISTDMGQTTIKLNKKKGPNVGPKVRPGQQINVQEGPNDPNIFKAVFMAGGPGSGKSYVAGKLLRGRGLKNSNPDVMFEILLKKAKLKPTPDDIGSEKGQAVRSRAKAVTNNQLETWIDGRLGLIIDGTGKEPAKIAKTSEMLQQLGYETMMLFVNTSLEVAQQRNRERERSIPDRMVSNMWNMVQDNIMKFQQIFKTGNFHVVDNSGGLEDPNRKDNFDRVSKEIDKFLAQPVSSRMAKSWLDSKRPQ
ncbi:MAG: hypothetical protein CBD31_01680 [Flavobacteriaceae bacterium TMED171]|jgi:predicted kinase|nr:MAG: hypothetical protein CBD31_01680 [Flavobacteriaceae bacterium TMED171]|tara:strand:+ start:353 stop:1237 length:885 start_codon:yes stop_codon:yes gene_type:complete